MQQFKFNTLINEYYILTPVNVNELIINFTHTLFDQGLRKKAIFHWIFDYVVKCPEVLGQQGYATWFEK